MAHKASDLRRRKPHHRKPPPPFSSLPTRPTDPPRTRAQFSIAFFYFSESESRKARTVPYKRPLPPLHLREQFAREAAAEEEKKMAALATAAGDAIVLDPPKDTPFTTEELAGFNGSVDGRPIYVAIKGLIFDGELSVGSGRRGVGAGS